MEEKATLSMLSILQQQYHPGEESPFSRYLPDELAQKLEGERVYAPEGFRSFVVDKEAFLSRLHYSWWQEALSSLPEVFHPHILHLLPEPERGRLEAVLNIDASPTPPNAIARAYFIDLLYHALRKRGLAPLSTLPEGPFLCLAEQKKGLLLEMIDLLGLYDIAEEILQIVDKKNIAALYNCLSTKKRQFLKHCLQHKERISLSKLGLEHWSGEKKKLDDAIHRRGLFRFAKALQGENPDLLWYIVHRLDMGRAKLVEHYCSQKPNPRVQEILRQELQTVMKFLQIGLPS